MQYNRKELLAALRIAAAIVPKRVVQPILGCVHITPGRIQVTNLDQYMSIDVECTARQTSAGLITPIHKLVKLLAALSSAHVYLDLDRDEWKLQGHILENFPEEDMPQPPTPPDGVTQHAVSIATLQRMHETCSWARSNIGGYGILESISWDGSEACATDGSRLSWLQLKEAGPSVMLDGTAFDAMHRLFKRTKPDTMVEVYSSGDNRTHFIASGWAVTSRNITGQYPRYKELFPERDNYKALIEFKRDDMLAALKQVAVTLDKRTWKIEINCADKTISSVDEEGNRMEVAIPIDASGDTAPFAVNYNYWKDAVESMPDQVRIKYTASLKPLIFDNDGDYKHLLMPIQVTPPKLVPKPCHDTSKEPRKTKRKQEAKTEVKPPKKQSTAPSSSVDAEDVLGDVELSATSKPKIPAKPRDMPEKTYRAWLKLRGVA